MPGAIVAAALLLLAVAVPVVCETVGATYAACHRLALLRGTAVRPEGGEPEPAR
jgi:hypothetical protein